MDHPDGFGPQDPNDEVGHCAALIASVCKLMDPEGIDEWEAYQIAYTALTGAEQIDHTLLTSVVDQICEGFVAPESGVWN